jgi:hypothetical protein
MKTWVRRSLNVGALTAGALLASGAAAQASPTLASTDNVGAGNGTQVLLPIQAPINLCGNAIGIGGFVAAGCEGGSAASLNPEWSFQHFQEAGGPTLATSGNTGLLNGTQVQAPIQVPINVCGNAVAVLGTASAGCEGGAKADQPEEPGYDEPEYPGYESYESPVEAEAVSTGGGTTMTTSGNVGLLNGVQALLPIQIPINICGNAIGVLGAAEAGCEGGASATNEL